ncbi:MAG: polysaccharide biosynthesis/export family protein [Gemmatimonadaceae bacterium]|nr:polysaccharide biosynthesis/export family protein [Gemmatimonadaceae bacterium]MDQ3519861.1 SLBB domain-containing protein [Gemmatimonadota bacterium]
MSAHINFAIRRRAFGGFFLLLCAASLEGQNPPAVMDTVREQNVGVLRPGDALRILVFRDPALSGEFPIDSRGYVQIPGLGDILVGGLTPFAARERLREQMLARGISREPELALQALLRVSVLGEVRAPGPFAVEPGTTLLQVLTRAGGPSERADLRKAQVVRDGKAIRVDLQSALAGSVAGRYSLFSNDVLYVPRKTGLNRENIGFLASMVGALVSVVTLVATLRR